MSPDQVSLVQTSFKGFVPVAFPASEFFYEELFRQAPETRRLFSEDLSEQRRKLVRTLTAVVQGLSYPDALMPVVRDLGRRHQDYKAEPHHYETVGAALIQTLRRYLGPDFTPEVERAWLACYSLLSREMTGQRH